MIGLSVAIPWNEEEIQKGYKAQKRQEMSAEPMGESSKGKRNQSSEKTRSAGDKTNPTDSQEVREGVRGAPGEGVKLGRKR